MKAKLTVIFGFACLLGLMLSFWLIFSYQNFLNQPNQLKTPVTLRVVSGVGAFNVIEQLQEQAVIAEPWFAKVYLKLNDPQQAIQAGTYQIDPVLTVPEIFSMLVEGKQLSFQVSLIEGLRFKEVLAFIRKNTNLTHTIDDWPTSKLLSQLATPYEHPEGLLFADTYSFPFGYSDIELLQRAYQRLIEVLNDEWENRAENLPYKTPYEALIMASIIEKETGLSSERARIAGVFVRRIEKRMRLQTDPTVIYGIGDEYDGDIKRIHLRTDTPYNTYTRKGLPPTPIAIVGREAINAALQPASGSELYFVSKGDGSHQFSDTLQEHLKAVRKYQLNR